MPNLKVYHYTDFSRIGKILGKTRGKDIQSGLEPRRCIGHVSYPAAETQATFGLLEPLPENWVNNLHFPLTWKTLVHDLGVLDYGKLLLEINVDTQTDKVFVADRGHIEGALYEDKIRISEQYHHETLKEGEQAFMASMVSLGGYLEKQAQGKIGYSLPEVLILQNMPAERVKVSSQQPLIEEDLAKLRQDSREYLINLVLRGYAARELAPWRTQYELIHGPLEIPGRSKETL